MHARLVRFTLSEDSGWEAKRLFDVMAKVARDLPGFIDITFGCDYQSGDYIWLSRWRTEEDCMNSLVHMWPTFRQAIGDEFLWEPVLQTFEVYEPE